MDAADVVAEVRDLLAQAEVFMRSADPSGAVARARVAVELATEELGRDDAVTQGALLALSRLETAARGWRQEVAHRQKLRAAHQLADSARFI